MKKLFGLLLVILNTVEERIPPQIFKCLTKIRKKTKRIERVEFLPASALAINQLVHAQISAPAKSLLGLEPIAVCPQTTGPS